MSEAHISILAQLAGIGEKHKDEFTDSTHFRSLEINNSAVADAVKRHLSTRSQAVAESAAAAIVAQLELSEKNIELYRASLSEVRRQEQINVNHIQTLAVARLFGSRTNNWIPLLHANSGNWDAVDIPKDEYQKLLKEIKADRNKPDPNSKASAAKKATADKPNTEA